MKLHPDTIQFIAQHRTDDVRSLALQSRKYPSVDMPAAITQIAGWQIAKEKVPTWAATDGIGYPAHLSMEQCSSELTARYKATLIPEHSNTLTDLTGGFGIDCAFLSERFRQATYVERQEVLCELGKTNFPLLGLNHITVHCGDGVEYLQKMNPSEWIFLDPARRDNHGGKTVAIADCEPNVAALEELLLQKAEHVMVKLSPMLDLTLALHDLQHVRSAHIISVNNECKELLLILGRNTSLPTDEVPIHCINLGNNPQTEVVFCRKEERALPCPLAKTLKSYLYEPNASLLKAGAFHTLSSIYQMEKLHPNSHLYTSDEAIPHFPGRYFEIEGACSLNKKETKEMLGEARKANLTVRNFPASVAELRKKLKLSEGGSIYLFATTLTDERKVLVKCRKDI